MKKISCLSLLLCVLLLAQALCIPAFATEVEPTETVTPTAPEYTIEELGAITVNSGCRTIEAQVPLGGSNPILKTAKSAFIYELNTNTVIYDYNPDMTISPGTLAKLVTAIVAIEKGDLDQELTVNSMSYRTLPGSAVRVNAGLKEGEKMTLRDMLHCMIMTWANDAAVTIAENIAGTQENFVQLMNQWVLDAGCENTKFTNVHGVSSVEAKTTARDVVRIYKRAYANAEFKKLLATTAYEVPATNKTETVRKLQAKNYLMEEYILSMYNYDGVTTGFAPYGENYGAHLVCTAETGGMTFVVVVMGAEREFAANGWQATYYGNYEEAWVLLDFAFDGYKMCRLLHDGQSLYQFNVAGGENQVVAQSNTAMDAVLPVNAKMKNLLYKYTIKDGGLTAPIAKDQVIATLEIWYQNSCIAETELHAMSSVRAVSAGNLDLQGKGKGGGADLKGILAFVGIVFLIIFIPFAIYLIINNVRRTLVRNRRRRRRKSRRRSR
ncbi:MAG: D-alanyl-D-alanine carboxypeptidase [Oscillospiraceae bacterium]|nr:D-alanyl-D-alanine carboxypeptidase [Oscillospiraceae bacterium]